MFKQKTVILNFNNIKKFTYLICILTKQILEAVLYLFYFNFSN